MQRRLDTWARGGSLILSAILCLLGTTVRAQQASLSGDSDSGWQRYDWLKPSEDQQRQAASGTSFSVISNPAVTDPFAVITNGSLWQETTGVAYTRRVADTLTLSYETSAITLNDGSNPYPPLDNGDDGEVSRTQKLGLQFAPVQELTLRGNVHDSTSDSTVPVDTIMTSGAGFSMEGHLPNNAVLTLGMNTDRSGADLPAAVFSDDTTYDAQVRQPLGQMPLTAVLKSHYEETTAGGALVARMPSLEQSLVWKPVQDTTVQMGLRQQHYQDFPGLANQFNQALFADWAQKVLPDVTWHSYAEVLNSRGIQDSAPGVPLTSGANGTPQATPPGGNVSPTSALPISIDDQTLTFSTGPSFHIHKDISASVEYSNRWDKNPLPGNVGQEQRVSVSVKGTF
jgi:hypothetical protein